jgi:uncharacterized protein
MGAQENLNIVRSGYEAFGQGDIPGVLAVFDEGIQWHISGRSGLSGTYKGHDEVVGFFTQLGERSGGTFNLEVHDMLASDDHVVVLTRERAQRDGKSIDARVAHVWHLSDGKATEFWGIADDVYAQDEFWA